MADLDLHHPRILPGSYLGEISALSFLPLSPLPLLLAGSGSELLVYDIKLGTLLKKLHVFDGIRVHGIAVREVELEGGGFLIGVYGEKRVKVFELRVEEEGERVEVELVGMLRRFDHWILDACFSKENYLAVGLSDNSVAIWDMNKPTVVLRVKSPDRCLLYSMRIWGDSIKVLRIASGTIYNEIIVWKLIPQDQLATLSELDSKNYCTLTNDGIEFRGQQYVPIHLSRLIGHEGSIFRIAWSSDGSRLMSVSDDRSARIWIISDLNQACRDLEETTGCHLSDNLVLFGHNARIWDCCISDSIFITAGEDCTCRVWGMDGEHLSTIKEHIGRGIWRCLYDPKSSLLITAGFDSAIKIHLLHSSSLGEMSVHKRVLDELKNQSEIFSICAPKVSNLMDSKSEYVRCLQFSRENAIYVTTNNGYLHHVQLSYPDEPVWTELAHASKEAPVICMDLISINSYMEDIIAVGDGKGNASVMKVQHDGPILKCALSCTWPAEKERQLLGIFWCNSLGCNHLFTADPRGNIKLWNISYASNLAGNYSTLNPEVSLAAVFTSSFGSRIMCLDASTREEVLICGDQRGNLSVYPLSKSFVLARSSVALDGVSSLSQFKGAHGISSVTSVLIATSNLDHVEVRTTGGDGCICHFRYIKNVQNLDFFGMKQVKELGTIQSFTTKGTSEQNLAQGNYAVGFMSADFIIWNVINESKTVQVPCGGWRRPYSYYLGEVPEYQNCFAYLKDNYIHIHRLWVAVQERELLPKVLHTQYHGRETHSLCFISSGMQPNSNRNQCSWLATGCEDGTVRLTSYKYFDSRSWCDSKLLGEHVGGSAVRSICFVSKIYDIAAAERQKCSANHNSADNKNDELLLISVGAKQVLTSWRLQDNSVDIEKLHLNCSNTNSEHMTSSSTPVFSSISFQWLSSHMPPKFVGAKRKLNCKPALVDQHENDWRYMAVTAFLVKHADTKLRVCFVVVACSDATLMLRALLLPYRLWVDIAALGSQTSPVLALQHTVIPGFFRTEDNIRTGNAYLVISGSTDGSITFWDLSETVGTFMRRTLELKLEMLLDCQTRPQTGRGSQGGRWWKSLINRSKNGGADSIKEPEVSFVNADGQSTENISSYTSSSLGSDFLNNQNGNSQSGSTLPSSEIHEISPLYVLNYVHQSGVNCLHISERKGCLQSGSEVSYCILSGGDDQAVHYLAFELKPQVLNPDSCGNHLANSLQYQFQLRILHQERVDSAHSSAVKGIWTDGIWAFSTGLDQRIRCWKVGHNGKLSELAHLIVSVPEPEDLDALRCEGGRYQIAVAGRGMQMADFYTSTYEDGKLKS